MTLTEKLLNMDAGKLAKPTKEVELPRYSEMLGEKVTFTCQAIDTDAFNTIREQGVKLDKKGNLKETDTAFIQAMMIKEGVTDPNFTDATLMQKYNATTPIDLVNAMLLPGEVQTLYDTINELSGFTEEQAEADVKEIKN